jgi:hypothetical protein
MLNNVRSTGLSYTCSMLPRMGNGVWLAFIAVDAG